MAPMFALPTFTFQRRWLFAAVLLSAALFYAGSRTLPGRSVGGLEITAWTVDGGGGVSTGGTFSLYGVAGQPDAGTLTGNTFTLYGGFLHPAAAAPGGSTCPNQSANIVTNGSGAFNAVWCGQDVTLAALDASYGAPGTNTMSAVFLWDNGTQQFKFWFRGFPIGFQTIPATALHVGYAYFFQTTAQATIPQGPLAPFTLALAGASNLTTTAGGAYGIVWAGADHAALADFGAGFLGAGQSTGISAIFQWDNTAQQFKFWFRGFPIGFQTMTGGVLRGSYYFFQATGALSFPMN